MNYKIAYGYNDVLIGHTTICEASRLISGLPSRLPLNIYSKPPYAIHRLLELCALIEAVVLHDTLFTLPGTLPEDVEGLELRKQLLASGILRELPPTILSEEIVPTITESLLNAFKPDEREKLLIQLQSNYDIQHRLNSAFSDASGSSSSRERGDGDNLAAILETDMDLFGEGGALQSIAGFTLELIVYGSGSYESGVPDLRSLLYWQVADRIRLPWYPDVMRVKWIMAVNRNLRVSLVDQVYSIVAAAFDTTIDELLAEDFPAEIVIPPLGALLLSRCSKQKDIIEQIFKMRNEFKDFRDKFREIEQNKRNAKSISELRSHRAKTEALLKAVASRYSQPDQSIIETSLGYAPDVLNILANPLDPGRYKSELLKKPYDWIRDWWLSRPASQLFSVTKKLENLELYGKILRHVFGIELTNEDISFIREHNSNMRHLLKRNISK